METRQNLKISREAYNCFLKNNRVIVTDDKIIAILAQLKKDTAGIYTQKKIDQIEDYNDIQDWNDFVEEIKIVFSNKSKTVDAE